MTVIITCVFPTTICFSHPLISKWPRSWAASLPARSVSVSLDLHFDAINLGSSIITAILCLYGTRIAVPVQHRGDMACAGVYIHFLLARRIVYSLLIDLKTSFP